MSSAPKYDTRTELILKILSDGLLPRSSPASCRSSARDLAVSMFRLFGLHVVKTEVHGDDEEDAAVLAEVGISGVVSVVRNEHRLPFACFG